MVPQRSARSPVFRALSRGGREQSPGLDGASRSRGSRGLNLSELPLRRRQHLGRYRLVLLGTGEQPVGQRRVLAPLAVDQAAVRTSFGHQHVGSSARLIGNGNATSVTRMRRERPRAAKMSRKASRVVTRPACAVGGPRVRAQRAPADCAAVPPSSTGLRRERAAPHDAEARSSTVVAPGRGARHPVDRVHSSSVPGGEPRGFVPDLDLKVADQQRPTQAPAGGPLVYKGAIRGRRNGNPG